MKNKYDISYNFIMLASCKIAILRAWSSCAIDFQTESVLALNKKLISNLLSVFYLHVAWPFTILQNDNITISWDLLRLAAPAAMLGHIDAVSLK